MMIQHLDRFWYVFTLLLIFNLCTQVVPQQPQCKVYNFTYVDCEYRGFNQLPDNIPLLTTHLELSNNAITSLPPNGMTHLTSIQELHVVENTLHAIFSESLHGLYHLKTLNLNFNTITTIDGTAFSNLTDLEILNMRGNLLKMVPDQLCVNLHSLRVLDISANLLSTLSTFSLVGLYHLEELHLNLNQISELSMDVFQDLKELKYLQLEDNRLSCLPGESLLPLYSIETIILSKNMFYCDRNITHIHNLPRLKTLQLMSCNLQDDDIHKLDFANVAIQKLDLADNNLISPNLFPTFQNISILDLDMNRITANTLEGMLNDTQDSAINLKELSLSVQSDTLDQITETTLKGLRRSKLEILDLSYNGLQSLPVGGFQWLPFLKTLDISWNILEHIPPGAFSGLQNLQKLELMVNCLRDITQLPLCLSTLSTLKSLNLHDNQFGGEIPAHIFGNLKSLLILDLSENEFTSIHQDSFTSLSGLKELDLSYNQIHHLAHAVFTPLISLQTLNLEQNMLQSGISQNLTFTHHINPFKNMMNLTELILTYAEIDSLYLDVPSLTRLEIYGLQTPHLNLAMLNNVNPHTLQNLMIQDISLTYDTSDQDFKFYSVTNLNLDYCTWVGSRQELVTFLKTFPNLEVLSMKRFNRIDSMDILPDNLKHLRSIDLSASQIKHIETKVFNFYPDLQFVNFGGTLFDCADCTMKSFIDWLKTDKKVKIVQSNYFDGYICETPTNKKGTPLYNLTFRWELCTNITLTVALPLTSFFILLVTLISICFHYRWYLQYFIFLLKLKCGRYKLPANDEEQPLNTLYDAFVVYNQHDRPWVMQQLVQNLENIDPPNFKLCIHDRDFLGGNDIFDNILNSIQKSHKTMLLLSPNFAESEWCYFEMRMAQDHLFTGKRDILILVLLEDIPNNVMPRVLRKMLRTNSYLKWPNNEIARRLFWKKLKLALRSGNRVNRVADF